MDSAGWDARYAAEPDLLWGTAPNRFVVEELAGLAPGRALDIAAGEGRNAGWLAQRGWRVTAIDFSPVAVDRGRRLTAHLGTALTWTVADVLTDPPARDSYDAVLVIYLHLPPAERAVALARAASALAPRGTLLVVGHDRTNLTQGFGGPQDPSVLYTPGEIVAELGGLQVCRAETVRRPVDGKSIEALDTVVVAVRRLRAVRP